MRVTVAILGAGSLIGQGLIKALKLSNLPTRLVALDFFPHAVGLYWADAAHMLPDVLSPSVGEEDYVQRLIEILRSEGVQVLLIAVDFEVMRLARHRPRIEAATGCTVVVSSPRVAEIADDKWATAQFLVAHGLPAPRSAIERSAIDALAREVGYPLIVKPRRGARSRGMSEVREPSQLTSALALAGPDPIAQEAVGTVATEYTCGAIILDGACQGTIVMRRDLRDGNTFRAYLDEEPPAELEALVARTAMALQPFGPVNIQLRVGPRGPAIFEMNARFSGTTAIRALVGFNEAEALVRWTAFGERLPLIRQRSGVVLRYWQEQFVSWEQYRQSGRVAVSA